MKDETHTSKEEEMRIKEAFEMEFGRGNYWSFEDGNPDPIINFILKIRQQSITQEREKVIMQVLEAAKSRTDIAGNYIPDVKVIDMVRLSDELSNLTQ